MDDGKEEVMPGCDARPAVLALWRNLKQALPELEELKARCDDEWGTEEHFYRFYHQSFKVYRAQDRTLEIVKALEALGDGKLNAWFTEIVKEGTGHVFVMNHNADWLRHTRPILEAYAHAKMMLDAVVKYGRALEAPPNLLPSGWALVLYLYDLR